jgi:hypothetical protein
MQSRRALPGDVSPNRRNSKKPMSGRLDVLWIDDRRRFLADYRPLKFSEPVIVRGRETRSERDLV